ncbi:MULTISPECIES: type I methionyl aminopeptidase [unclassified Fusibacter]|uniref:type I methionyl aminopeptidase n=1 Tax=unclassified Fusibacter TaxID=2624464 RepID=UPI0010135F31|nr:MULTISPECIES: type I methionyl aminopeptidase [unclassified Fusibacter]MCK8061534.1 type I methionyl aminopeptidase [Fusibacter sp. A2]NPE23738.1 type I methionyl aminopeptidase [Fusibacter sp. A1]RXV58765.1 type I methionyl aminopeptidase [Fusibacter sp. A1]
MIYLKSQREIELMRQAGRIVALAHEAIRNIIEPGITTLELDAIAEKVIRENGGIPAFKGYGGFPGSICASVNDEVVHGIPGHRKLVDGDIISVDIGVNLNGYYGDAAKTHPVGTVSEEARLLIEDTRQSFYEGLKMCEVGHRLSDISHAVQSYSENKGYGVVRDLVGHGIGTALHEDPQVPNYGPSGKGPRLQVGMVLAIEPMINIGSYHVETLEDNWTVVTLDRKLSAHYEHTVAITKDGPELLTVL